MKRRKENTFNEYIEHLNKDDVTRVNEFFINFKQHMSLPLTQEKLLRRDLEEALMYYNAIGVSVEKALERLDNANLGGFYARPPCLYYALDDAAKIYPLSMKPGFMTVFRLSANLKDEVIPALLQIALTFTIKRFPRFATTLKKGVFWHFLDANKQRYPIEEDDAVPCRPIKISSTGAKSFRVRYYKTRISVEFFHTLTDGRGGLIFLQTLIATYLHLVGAPLVAHESTLNINDTPDPAEDANEFKRSTHAKASGFKEKPSLQMSGRIAPDLPYQILHFKLASGALKNIAKTYNVTVTSYITTLLLLAAKHATEANSGDLSVQVPVDMRRYYESNTLANFSMYAGIKFPIGQITTAETLFPLVQTQLVEKASYEKMSEMMYSAHKMNKDVRGVPLFLKSPIAKIAYGLLGEKLFTMTFSNVGVVSAPDHFKDYIDSYDFILGAPALNRAAVTLITFNEVATLSITKSTKDPSFEKELYRLLQKDGLAIEVEGSAIHERKRRVPKTQHSA